MRDNPRHWLRRHIEHLGDVSGKRVANLLGSNGREAVPLALLGARVTVVDISSENARYARELAAHAGVELDYIVGDLLELDLIELQGSFDLVYMEGGILHYFSDLSALAQTVVGLLKNRGRLVLNDFHPFRKCLGQQGDMVVLSGDYFASDLQSGPVAYESFFPEDERDDFPRCSLRLWTMGEIVSVFAASGLVIQSLVEEPHYEHGRLPGQFTLVAHKPPCEDGGGNGNGK